MSKPPTLTWRLELPHAGESTPSPALLIGDGQIADDVLHEINGKTGHGIRIVGCVHCAGRSPDDLRAVIADRVRLDGIAALIRPAGLFGGKADPEGVTGIDLEELYEQLFGRVALPLVDDAWFAKVAAHKPGMFYAFLKRTTDIVLSLAALILLSPVWLVLAAILYVQGGTPLIFQKRIGLGGREIAIIKFRTMLFDDGEDPEKKKLNEITKIGAFLRKTQLDEVPQFWNVLRGDLSLIGPRPEIPHLVQAYEEAIPHYQARHMIQPGISGWAQIKHASPPKFGLDIEATREKLSYDLYYLRHRSTAMEFAIILGTAKLMAGRSSR